jgi:hypothetical protein
VVNGNLIWEAAKEDAHLASSDAGISRPSRMKDPENISWGPDMHRAASSSLMDIETIVSRTWKTCGSSFGK